MCTINDWSSAKASQKAPKIAKTLFQQGSRAILLKFYYEVLNYVAETCELFSKLVVTRGNRR